MAQWTLNNTAYDYTANDVEEIKKETIEEFRDNVIAQLSQHHFDDKKDYDLLLHRICEEVKQIAEQMIK